MSTIPTLGLLIFGLLGAPEPSPAQVEPEPDCDPDPDCKEPDPESIPHDPHGSHQHIREPMVFDLIRGLGAKRNELEANVLMRYGVSDGRLHWAPEVEWVFIDGVAIEFELPEVGYELEELKFAGQVTLPRRPQQRTFISGVQAIVEIPHKVDHATMLTALYVAGAHFDPVSMTLMIGPRFETTLAHGLPLTGLTNAAVFVDAHERASVGLEVNVAVGRISEALVMPQLHLQLGPRVRIQSGAGVGWSSHTGLSTVFAMRLVLE